MSIVDIGLIIVLFWLSALSLFLFWLRTKLMKFTVQVKKGDLIKLLDKLIDSEDKNSKSLKALEKEIKRIDREGLVHVQKVGLVRFNPFKEIGGDHSFSIALLDGEGSGFLLTGLHTRERTRVYLKEVVKAKSRIELSQEEKRALALAQKSQ